MRYHYIANDYHSIQWNLFWKNSIILFYTLCGFWLKQKRHIVQVFLSVVSAPKTFNLDIALVKLAEPVKLNDMVNIACIPDKEDYFPPGTVCVTAGWGHTIEGEYDPQSNPWA